MIFEVQPDGEKIVTRTSVVMPVRHEGMPAMLKVSHDEDERRGNGLMIWWEGDGAARVLAHDGDSLLLERAMGMRSLAAMAAGGGDDQASRIICAAAARLHAPRARPLPELVPLSRWFEPLAPTARTHGGILAEADLAARALLADPRDVVVLHGDIHHGNILDAGDRGWLAIDPKGLIGERCFDFVNILRNPDAATALAPGRFAHQVNVVSEAASLDRRRLMRWTLAFMGLSAAWHLGHGRLAALDLAVADLSAAALES
ncbi:MAG TPA: aminoglycoside phosphotransferase family protein [Reyranella sp.]|jgi:streptomycin 6-kinase